MLAILVMLTAPVAAQTASCFAPPNKFEIGFNARQYQKDFGVGLHVRSPYWAGQTIALKVGANLQWLEHFNGTETTWSPYQNFQLGIRGRSIAISDHIAVYGEGGVMIIVPNSDFSSQGADVGGYGLFGFEFKPTSKLAYFVELGGAGSGATADKTESKSIYSHGFLTSVGLKIAF